MVEAVELSEFRHGRPSRPVTPPVTPVTPADSLARGASLLDDSAIGRAWARAYDRAPAPSRWDPEAVNRRVLEMLRVHGVTVPGLGPRSYGTMMPDYVDDERALRFRETALVTSGLIDRIADETREGNRVPFVPTSRQIRDADEASWWMWRFLADVPGPRRVFQIWCFCKATRLSFERARRSLARRDADGPWNNERTVRRLRVRASLAIACGLMRDGDRLSDGDLAAIEARAAQAPPPPEAAGPPGWWGQAQLAASICGLGAGVAFIHERVDDEYRGRNLGNAYAAAEHKGRISLLVARLKEECST